MLKAIDVFPAQHAPCNIKFDYYVAITYKSYDGVLPGTRYIFLGDNKNQAFELKIPLHSFVLSSFIFVAGKVSRGNFLRGDGPFRVGLPIIDLPRECSAFDRVNRVDMRADVTLLCNDEFAEIQISNNKEFNNKITHERVDFLLFDEELIGFRVNNLKDDEREVLFDYIARNILCI